MSVTDLGAGVHAVDASYDGVPLTVYLVEGDGLHLVDAGVATTPREHVAPALQALGARPRDLRWLLATHAHHDHVGGNGAVRGLHPSVRVAVHHQDAGWAASRERYVAELYRGSFPAVWTPPAALEARIEQLWPSDCVVDHRLEDEELLDLGAGRTLRAIPAPAHSPGHVMFHDARAGVLLAGDAIQGWSTPRHGRPWLFPFYTSVAAYLASLEAIRRSGAQLVCTAHFGPLRGVEVERALAEAGEAVARFDAALRDLVAAGEPVGLGRAAQTLLARWPVDDHGLQAYATAAAHLDALVTQGTATTGEDAGGQPRWTAT